MGSLCISGTNLEIIRMLKKRKIKISNLRIYNESMTQLIFTFIFLICIEYIYLIKKRKEFNRIYYEKLFQIMKMYLVKNINSRL